MNCEQGDIAIVVRSKNGRNLGKIVTCLRLATRAEINLSNNVCPGAIWVTDRPLTWSNAEFPSFCRDVCLASDDSLKPLRGNEQDDTTETDAGIPASTLGVAA